MGIKIKEIRIRNFRSYKTADINLSNNSVLIGANNAGKTSLLQAIQIAFTRGIGVGHEDIYINPNEILPKDRKAIIDVLVVPTDDENNEADEFNDVWFEHFGELRSEDSDNLKQFFAMRTIIAFDNVKGEYEIEKKALIDWPDTNDVDDYSEYKKRSITDKLLQSIPIFFMDAKRDIALEMKDRSSYWGRLVRDVGLNSEEIGKIESTLNDVNDEIIDRSPVLKHLTDNLSKISSTVSSAEGSIKINPVSRRIRDLNRGIDLTFKDHNSEMFPISNHGMGTRSWITFLTVVAYISWKIEQMEKEKIPYHPVILLEEPEAHLHPQAQRKIFHQIKSLAGQKIVSTHSPMIVGQANIKDIRHISKNQGNSIVNYIDISKLAEQEVRKINQEIFKTRGDLLFANAIILCEGETEEQTLPRFFEEFFGCETFEVGINVISVGGSGKYKPFLRIAKDLNINVYLLSDGEKDTIATVKKDIRSVFGKEKPIEEYGNIKFLPNEYDFEKYLVNEGYDIELDRTMVKLLGEDYLEKYITKKDKTNRKRNRTSEKCNTCDQFIFEDVLRNYGGHEGEQEALLDCIHDNKTAYSSIIADEIINNRKENKIPEIINDLFIEINKDLKIIIKEKEAVKV